MISNTLSCMGMNAENRFLSAHAHFSAEQEFTILSGVSII